MYHKQVNSDPVALPSLLELVCTVPFIRQMRRTALAARFVAIALASSLLTQSSPGQSAPNELTPDEDEFILMLDSYASYGGDIAVVDGKTGKKYHRGNEVVKSIHATIPKIMGGLHKILLGYEIAHLNYQIKVGPIKEDAIQELMKQFGLGRFFMDDDYWMSREKSVVSNLQATEVFQVRELVVWHREELSTVMPDNDYAKNIRYDPQAGQWQRRVLTHWRVQPPLDLSKRNPTRRYADKIQGLNLDTQKGFHIVNSGLPGWFPQGSLKEVDVAYPIIITRTESDEEQIDRIQKDIVRNFSYLYDPMTWYARRNIRYRRYYETYLQRKIASSHIRVENRDWFKPFLAHFINAVATVQTQGIEEVYLSYLASEHGNNRNALGEDLDLLNWHEDENREGHGPNTDSPVSLRFNRPRDAALVLLDAYLRNGDIVLTTFANYLQSPEQEMTGQELVHRTIAEATGHSAQKYVAAALKAQELGIKKTREDFENRDIPTIISSY